MTAPRQTEHPIDPQFTQRWSPRAFTGEAIPEATLLGLIEAARWAPSASNIQPWRFIYARRDTPAWTPLFDCLVEFNRGWAVNAAALVLVMSKKTWLPHGKTEPVPNPTHSFDAGAAWMSLALQAHLAGWPAHGMGGFDRDKARLALGVPSDHVLEAMVAIGRQGDKASLPEALQARETPSTRLALAQIAVEGRYSFD
ncbi:MAG: nitroreductase family protein [Burkholderiales bacterium]|nr:nitroreductase family protein [Burkholderiales bacterium]